MRYLGLLTIVVAIFISGVAGYFSIVGLAALFSAAAIPVIIMAAGLEIGKIIATIQLHFNWRNPLFSKPLKIYLATAVITLMLITGLGIYGFLSKGHIEQGIPIEQKKAEIAALQKNVNRNKEKITQAEEGIKRSREGILKIDNFLLRFDNRLSEFDRRSDEMNVKRAEVAKTLSKAQPSFFNDRKEERETLQNQLDSIDKQIETLEKDKAAHRSNRDTEIERKAKLQIQMKEYEDDILETRDLIDTFHIKEDAIDKNLIGNEVKLGPIKYVARLLNMDDPTSAIIFVIVAIMFVFDPLALVLLVSGLICFETANGIKKNRFTNLKGSETEKEDMFDKMKDWFDKLKDKRAKKKKVKAKKKAEKEKIKTEKKVEKEKIKAIKAAKKKSKAKKKADILELTEDMTAIKEPKKREKGLITEEIKDLTAPSKKTRGLDRPKTSRDYTELALAGSEERQKATEEAKAAHIRKVEADRENTKEIKEAAKKGIDLTKFISRKKNKKSKKAEEVQPIDQGDGALRRPPVAMEDEVDPIADE